MGINVTSHRAGMRCNTIVFRFIYKIHLILLDIKFIVLVILGYANSVCVAYTWVRGVYAG